jgi:hypothetical protein
MLLFYQSLLLSLSTQPSSYKKVIAVTVLRFANKQWRILNHHCTPFQTSTYTGNAVKISSVSQRARTNVGGSKEQESKKSAQPNMKPDNTIEKKSTKGNADDIKAENTVANDNGSEESLQSILQASRRNYLRSSASSIVDPEASLTRQTIQALRYLCKTGRLTKDEKEELIYDIVLGERENEESYVETSFKLIYKSKDAGRGADRNGHLAALEDFAEQCKIALKKMRSRSD